jgi:hypothetical protein
MTTTVIAIALAVFPGSARIRRNQLARSGTSSPFGNRCSIFPNEPR